MAVPSGPTAVGRTISTPSGVAAIAVRTGTPVVPVAWSSKYALTFNSWDRALIPLPFSRIHLIWGQALTPPADTADRTAIEEFRGEVERALLDVTQAADRNAGRVEPFCQGGAT